MCIARKTQNPDQLISIFVSTVFLMLDKMYFVHARGHILFTFKNENILVNILVNSIVNQYIST